MPEHFDTIADHIHAALAPAIAVGIDREALADALLLEGASLLVATIGRQATAQQLADMAAQLAVEG